MKIARKSPELLILLMTIGAAISWAVWLNLLNNFAIEKVDFTGAEIGILQSLREIPGFLAFTVILVLAFIREQKLAYISLALLGIGVMITGLVQTNMTFYLATIIMSVGMSNLDEIKNAYEILCAKTNNIALLHCVSAYPTNEKDANLSAIYKLKDLFDCIIGQSDHTNDIQVPLYAVANGAQVIEKHYRINDEMDCVDAPVSITEEQMTQMVKEIRRLEKILGVGNLGVRKAENDTVVYRRFSNLG